MASVLYIFLQFLTLTTVLSRQFPTEILHCLPGLIKHLFLEQIPQFLKENSVSTMGKNIKTLMHCLKSLKSSQKSPR